MSLLNILNKNGFKKILVVFFIATIFYGCSDSKNDTPVFISSDTAVVVENQLMAIKLEAVDKDNDLITYNISGIDSTSFAVNHLTGVVTFKTAPDYETKNSYTFIATASDSMVNVSQIVTIRVTDYFNPFKIARVVSDDINTNYLGIETSISGDYIAVNGVAVDSEFSMARGVYLFKKDANDTTKEIAKLQADGNNSDVWYGESISMDGDYLVVGAPYDEIEDSNITRAGVVYIYKIESDDSVKKIAKLQPSDAQSFDEFGISVSISGNYVVVGADETSNSDLNITGAGSAYVFKINSDETVTQIAKLAPDNPKENDWFGWSVSIDNNYVVVGGDGMDLADPNLGEISDAGAAYLFKINADETISKIAKLTASDANADDQFGWSLSIDDKYIVIGAPEVDTLDANATEVPNSGAAYLFKIDENESVQELTKFQLPEPKAYESLGEDISISGKYIISGVYNNSGKSIYLFKIASDDTVLEVEKFEESISQQYTYFGYTASIDREQIVIGAPMESSSNIHTGAVYLYTTEPLDKIYLYSKPDDNISIEEGSTYRYQFDAASPNGAIEYTLNSGDIESFVINENNISVEPPMDFETPVDSGADNRYEVNVKLQDSHYNEKYIDFSVTVTDKYFTQIAKIGEGNTPGYDWFGWSVSNSGEYIVAGAYDGNGTYLFKKDTDGVVSQIASLKDEDNITDGYFGSAVSISGNYIVVGADLTDLNDTITNSGSVYLYKIASDDTVDLITKIVPNDGKTDERFGISVSIDGDKIVVGTYDKDSEVGSAYLFQINSNDTVTQLAKITSSDGEAGDKFGERVYVNGDYIIVGVPRDSVNGAQTGSAYLFKIATDGSVLEKAKLQASDAQEDMWFGGSVAMDGDYIVVGDYYNSDRTGSLYIFKKDVNDNVIQLDKLVHNDAKTGDGFGASVAIDGKYILGGVYAPDRVGATYLFQIGIGDEITQVEKFQPEDIRNSDWFGKSISMADGVVVIGAPRFKDIGNIYIYEKDKNQRD